MIQDAVSQCSDFFIFALVRLNFVGSGIQLPTIMWSGAVVARLAHNQKVEGSSPSSATK